MAAPIVLRAASLQKFILIHRRHLIKHDQLKTTACNKYSYSYIVSRYSSSKANDESVKVPSTSENRENENCDFNEADDIFGILENGNIRDPLLEEPETVSKVSEKTNFSELKKTKAHSPKEQPQVILGKEKVLDVRFGFIRRDSDNPAIPVRKQRNQNFEQYELENNLTDKFESPDFVSRLFSPRQSDSNLLDNITKIDIHVKSDKNNFSTAASIFNPSEEKSLKGNETRYQSNYIDEQYFTTNSHEYKPVEECEIENNYPKRNLNENPQINSDRKDLNYFDEFYFGSNLSSAASNHDLSKGNCVQDRKEFLVEVNEKKPAPVSDLKEEDLNFVDDQYFGEQSINLTVEKCSQDLLHEDIENLTDSVIGESLNDGLEIVLSKNDNGIIESSQQVISTSSKAGDSLVQTVEKQTKALKHTTDSVNKKSAEKKLPNSDIVKDLNSSKPGDIIVETVTKQAKRLENRVQPNLENPETAFDVAMKYRLDHAGKLPNKNESVTDSGRETHVARGKVDSKGYRILKEQVPDWSYTPHDVLAKVLRDSILYDKDDIIAIDKPYGLPSHGGPGVRVSIGQLTPILAQLLDKTGNLQKLYLVHRLDKETTGVMLLAKTAEMAWKLRGFFKRREVVKKYWLITKGIPSPEEGIIDIPLRETSGQTIHKMCLQPESSEKVPRPLRKSNLKSHTAITHYRILDSQNETALVECQPETGVKHQIRVHMSHGLNTPILGDHKYSHFNKLAPQKLYPEILTKLGIRQSKVRHVAMHLHAKTVVLPEFIEGRNLVLSARLPRHFSTNMKRLQLKPPSY